MIAKLGTVTYCKIFFHYVSWVYYSGNCNSIFHDYLVGKKYNLLLFQFNARKMIKIQKTLNLPPFYWDFSKMLPLLGVVIGKNHMVYLGCPG
jgi:hypothetical protein